MNKTFYYRANGDDVSVIEIKPGEEIPKDYILMDRAARRAYMKMMIKKMKKGGNNGKSN